MKQPAIGGLPEGYLDDGCFIWDRHNHPIIVFVEELCHAMDGYSVNTLPSASLPLSHPGKVSLLWDIIIESMTFLSESRSSTISFQHSLLQESGNRQQLQSKPSVQGLMRNARPR